MHPFLKIATKKSIEHAYDPRLGYNLCAIIVKGGAIISVGFNSITRNSFVDYLACNDHKPFRNRHAEMDCVLKARAKTDLTGCKIYVARTKISGGVGTARPCHLCQNMLTRYGVKRAIYTISSTEFGVLNLQRKSDAVHNLLEAV